MAIVDERGIIHVTDPGPIIVNSKPKAAISGAFYHIRAHITGHEVSLRSCYICLIWVKITLDGITEISRVNKFIKNGDHTYRIIDRAPPGATHAILGIRVNCDGAMAPFKRSRIKHEDLDGCSLTKLPGATAPLLHFVETGISKPMIDLNVELVSYCNLRCLWCSLDHEKPKQTMNVETFELILDRILRSKVPIRRIDLHNAGETLLHPRFEDYMKALGEKRASSENFPYTALTTNGIALDRSKALAILKNGAVDLIRVSMDGGTPEEYERIRRRARFGRLAENLMGFITLNEGSGHRVSTGIICIVDEKYPLSAEWMSDDFKNIFSRMDHVELRRPHNWNGSVELGLGKKNNVVGMCHYMRDNSLVVLPNGDVTVCCNDLNSQGVIGNIHNDTFPGILYCKNRKIMMDLMKSGRRREIGLCRMCDKADHGSLAVFR
jgi:radical SAM protein with 4Fe4S-binding SPASM domain